MFIVNRVLPIEQKDIKVWAKTKCKEDIMKYDVTN